MMKQTLAGSGPSWGRVETAGFSVKSYAGRGWSRWLLSGITLIATLITTTCHGTSGLDFVVLVDVSWSMQDHLVRDGSGAYARAKGRDSQRLRWDAVKLVLDLLTEEDRILVLPFNQDCPACWPPRSSGRETKILPGKLETTLRFVDRRLREELEPKLLRFIHLGNPLPDDKPQPPEWSQPEVNVDYGSTGILGVLGTAGEKIALVPPDKNRKVVVLLLTDGSQSTRSEKNPDPKDDRLVREGRWQADERIRFFVERGIPVHTLGLGEEAAKGNARKLLEELSALTGGSPALANTNLELVEKFRELVWSLRDCWVAKIDHGALVAAGGSISTNPLHSVLDFGLFVYEVDKQQQRPDQPRILFAPDPLPEIRWRGLNGQTAPREFRHAGKELPTVTLDGKAGPPRCCGYSYHYYDGRRRDEDPLGTLFRTFPQLELELALRPDQLQREHQAYFIKRGPRFEIRLEGSRFYRHQPLPLHVVWLNPGPNAVDTTYEVRAELFPPGAPAEAVRTQLLAQRPDEFVNKDDQFSAADLPSPSHFESSTDNYVLRVVISEPLGGGQLAYQCTLPPRSILIDNTVLLKPTPPVTLTRAKTRQSVVVETVYPYRGELPLKVKRTLPVSVNGKETLDAEQFQFSALPPSNQEDEARLQDGKLTLVIALNPDNLPAAGRYLNGLVELSRSGAAPFRIQSQQPPPGPKTADAHPVPFDVEIGPISVKLVPDEPAWRTMTVGPATGRDVQSFHLALTEGLGGGSAMGIRPPTIELVRSEDTSTLAFSSEELWLQSASPEVSPGLQKLALKTLEQPVQVVFQPDLKRQRSLARLVGQHKYQFRVRGDDVKPLEENLALEVEPPRIAGIEPVRLLLCPGAKTPAIKRELQLRWIPGACLAFQIETESRSLPFHAVVDGKANMQATFAVPYAGATSPVELTAVASATAAGQELSFALQVPDQSQMPYGKYAAQVPLSLDGTVYCKLGFILEVDAIHLMYPNVTPEQRERFKLATAEPQRATQIPPVVQGLDQPLQVSLGLQSELRRKLDMSVLRVELTGPKLPDGRGPYFAQVDDQGQVKPGRFLPSPSFSLEKLRVEVETGRVWGDFQLPRVVSAHLDAPYVIDGVFTYCEEPGLRDLGAVPFRLTVRFLDPYRFLLGVPAEKP